MEKFGFKNFKRFKNFPMISLAPITLLVGPNNSGKSSFIKASLLLVYNLIESFDDIDNLSIKTPFIDHFSFFNDTTTNFGWGDYSSSLNNETVGENIIFRFTCADYEFELEYGKFEPIKAMMSPYPNLWRVKLKSLNDDILLKIEYYKGEGWKCNGYKISAGFLSNWAKQKSNNIIAPFTDNNFYVDEKGNYVFDLPSSIENEYDYLNQLVEKTANKSDDIVANTINDEIIEKGIKECISHCLNNLKDRLKQQIFRYLIYVETHTAIHKSAWDVTDKNNYVAQTLKEYLSKSSLPFVDNGHKFVTKWLKNFNIGERFIIRELCNGEILSVDIIHDWEKYHSESKDKLGSYTNLGQMGTGSIQIFTMLLKLAIAIRESQQRGRVLLEIEEPEQNLHPALQSELADVFKDVYDLSGGMVNLIIETHSEYLIRRTQVLVAEFAAEKHISDEEELVKQNPFKVYYFPENGTPYDMEFQKSGKFIEGFGTGFFDVADNSAMDLFEFEEE